MVVVDQDPSIDLDDNQENEEAEEENSDTEADKPKSKAVTDPPPTELGRFRLFTHKVAQCAARSFCETYVRPLVIKNPNPLPESVNQNQEVQSATLLNTLEDTKDLTEIILNPKEEEQPIPIQTQRREKEEESDKEAEVLDSNKYSIAATVNLLQEKEMIIVDKLKPSLSFDIANILSYLPCRSLAASCDQKDDKAPIDLKLNPTELSETFDHNSRSCTSTDDCQKDDAGVTDEESSPIHEEEL